MSRFIPKKAEKEVISIRIDTELLKEVDKTAAKSDISRNELIVQCVEFALSNLDSDSKKNLLLDLDKMNGARK
ncbi:MAG: ribbon-helix-helix protein, CopG family [Ruminococcaceae bacterium]|nr:ribbon-helix-helix protein, CopG family [Oscillospiraceae bacterium]